MSDLSRLWVLAARACRSTDPAQRAMAGEWFDLIRDELLSDAARHLESDDPTIREEAARLLRQHESTATARHTGAEHRSDTND